jgi:GNAT superfamily N-acetyltransferase
MAAAADRPIEVRPAEASDRAAVLELLSASLGWSTDAHFQAYFAWKHEENPFGRSPGWVALDGDEVVGFRTFLRWEHAAPDGTTLRAVRAVDTATRPSHQGRGIFRLLTLQALDDLRAEDTDLVFNTPNDQSRPGYLKMGWTAVGRLPAAVRMASLRSPARLLASRVPAERWSSPSALGHDAREVLADPEVGELLAAVAPGRGLRTRRTLAYLRWRYGFEPLRYRVVTLGDGVAGGLAVFRLRRRGPALECALCEVLVPAGDRAAERALVRAVVRGSGADHVIRVGGPVLDRSGFVRLHGQGPILAWLPLHDGVPGGRLDEWDLGLGDVELF